jgi:glycosyltransferase involved in cell wall biosynthesis
MPGPLVLALPTLNCAETLPQTLQSLAAQGDALRWWLQDSLSRDGTHQIARLSARPGDTVVSESDRGHADALNKAFARMSGEVLGFINASATLTPGAAAAVLDSFVQNPEIDLVYGEVEWTGAAGEPAGHHKGAISSLEELLDIHGVWFSGRQWVGPEVFFRRSLWDKAGPFDTQYHQAFDFAFWVQCMLAGARVLRIPRTLVRCRRRNPRNAAPEMHDIVRKALALNPPLSRKARAAIVARINYEMYQLAPDPKPSLAKALFRNPSWLRSPAVRRRLLDSMRRRT